MYCRHIGCGNIHVFIDCVQIECRNKFLTCGAWEYTCMFRLCVGRVSESISAMQGVGIYMGVSHTYTLWIQRNTFQSTHSMARHTWHKRNTFWYPHMKEIYSWVPTSSAILTMRVVHSFICDTTHVYVWYDSRLFICTHTCIYTYMWHVTHTTHHLHSRITPMTYHSHSLMSLVHSFNMWHDSKVCVIWF